MKNTITPILTVLLLLTISSCSNDFLEENKKQINGYNLDTYLFVEPTSMFSEVSVTLGDLKNKDFKVLQYPKIIHFETFDGHIDESGKLSFTIKVDAFDSQVSPEPVDLGEIILHISDFGLLSIPVVHLNHGTPRAEISDNLIDFDTDYREQNFQIGNPDNGILYYRLTSKPSWLKIREPYLPEKFLETGNVMYLGINDYDTYAIVPDVSNLSPGIHEGEIIFETSDVTNPVLKITVKIRKRTYENPATMIPIEGKVVGVAFDENTNTVYFITQNPAKIIAFNALNQTKTEKVLERNPHSLALSADEQKILIGESGQLDILEKSSLSSLQKVMLNFTVIDIVDGDNQYYYFSNIEREIYSYNTVNNTIKEEIINRPEYNIKIHANIILKIKNKPHLLLADTYNMGIYLIDTSDPSNLKNTNYWLFMIDNRTTIIPEERYLFIPENYIHRLPDENTGSTLYYLGSLKYDNLPDQRFLHLSFSSATSSIWSSYSYYDQDVFEYKGVIMQFDAKTFDLKQRIEPGDYVTTYNGVQDYYKTMAPYVFSTSDGSKLVLIKNITKNRADAWHLEVMDVSN